MEVEVQITKPKRYKEKVTNVYLDLKILDSDRFSGSVCIDRKDQSSIPYYGLIEANEYEQEYEFVLVLCEPKIRMSAV